MIRRTLDTLFPRTGAVLLDGAMGSALHAGGWPADRPTVLANLEAPELVGDVHRSHAEAGASVLCSNTFGALLAPSDRCLEAVRAGVRLARESAGPRGRVAGSVAAFGLAVQDPQLEHVVRVLVEEGVDLLVFETCNGLRDAAAALEFHDRVAPDLPCVVSASTTDGSRADRARVREVVEYLRREGTGRVEAGLNCCRGPHDALRLATELQPAIRWVKPSTGVARDLVGDDVMAAFARAAAREQVRYVGGCCGTSGATLTAMAAALAHDAREA